MKCQRRKNICLRARLNIFWEALFCSIQASESGREDIVSEITYGNEENGNTEREIGNVNYRNGHQTRVCHQFMNSFQGIEPNEGEEMRQMGYLVVQDFSSEFFISWVMFVFHIELANFKL